MYIIFIILCLVFAFLFADWHARYVFVARGYCRRYGHGKSFNRAKKHYKSHWSFIQRMLWIPIFNEIYESRYKMMAIFSYIHFVLTLIAILCLLIDEFAYTNNEFWMYSFIVVSSWFLVRFIYDNDIVARAR